MHALRNWVLASLLLWPGAALAADGKVQPAPGIASEHRLSDAEIEKILDAAALKREAAAPAGETAEIPIHGEVGFAIGTGGYRSAFGTAIVPLSEEGVAILSFETNTFRPIRIDDLRER